MPLHFSSNKCSSSGGPNYIKTSCGIRHSGGWLSAVPVHSTCFVLPDGCIVFIQFYLMFLYLYICFAGLAMQNFMFCWPSILMQHWVMTNLMHFFSCIYFMPLHVSSNKSSSSGGPNCINTSSGIRQSLTRVLYHRMY
jgi:hypothetical protein